MLKPTNPEPLELTVGVGRAVTARVSAQNTGSEPAYDAALVLTSSVSLPPPRQLDCEKEGAEDTGGDTQVGNG